MDAEERGKWFPHFVDDLSPQMLAAVLRVPDTQRAAAVLCRDAARLLPILESNPDFGRWWNELTSSQMLSNETGPVAAAIVAWKQAGGSADPEQSLPVLTGILAQAAAQYDQVRGRDLRTMRLVPPQVVAQLFDSFGDPRAAEGEDPAHDMMAVSHSLMLGFWSMLGSTRNNGEWCGAFHVNGIKWLPGPRPEQPAERCSFLLHAADAGVYSLSVDPLLAERLPRTSEGWAQLSSQDLAECTEEAELSVDPRLGHMLSRSIDLGAWPGRRAIELDLASRPGQLRLLLGAPLNLRAPIITDEDLTLPWLLQTDRGCLFGLLTEGETCSLHMMASVRSPERWPDSYERAVHEYAGLIGPGRKGVTEALTSMVTAAVIDVSDPDRVEVFYEECPSSWEEDPSLARNPRRQLARDRESGRGPARLVPRRPRPEESGWSGFWGLHRSWTGEEQDVANQHR